MCPNLTVTGPPVVGFPPGADPAVGPGTAVWLDGDRDCGAAPTLFPSQFQAPRDGHVCFAVAPGFTPRYLVLINDGVAVDLR